MWSGIGCLVALFAIATPTYAQAGVVDQWRKKVGAHLQDKKGYSPPAAAGAAGTARVGFVVSREGKLISNWLIETTGVSALDRGALEIIERADPFPPAPPEVRDENMRLDIQFVFQPEPPFFHDPVVAAKMKGVCRGC